MRRSGPRGSAGSQRKRHPAFAATERSDHRQRRHIFFANCCTTIASSGARQSAPPPSGSIERSMVKFQLINFCAIANSTSRVHARLLCRGVAGAPVRYRGTRRASDRPDRCPCSYSTPLMVSTGVALTTTRSTHHLEEVVGNRKGYRHDITPHFGSHASDRQLDCWLATGLGEVGPIRRPTNARHR